ncbi:TIP41-like protein [Parasponia andersonii]|uniref:TIP41-like protein n=1 Tax=Parasponia andersonii TaxID=3476 RepID=A0A2P5CFW8_PARAD|nr:TIP41-like protein [Parasponia andersonii]
MADGLDDAEFWLPPQFLTEDDVLTGVTNSQTKKYDGYGFAFGSETDALNRPLFPNEFPCGFGSLGVPSDLSSPVESVVGSSETESDEEDYLAGLTLQMARSTLEDGFKNTVPENGKPWTMSGSPQSTLCAVGSGCGQGSSRESPKAHSRVASPPETWDLLNAAAGEVAKMRMNEEEYRFYHSRGLLCPPRKPSPVGNPVNADMGFYINQSISQKQLQYSQFQQLRHQQMMKQQSSAFWGSNTTQSKLAGRYQMHQTQPMVHNGGRNDEFVVTKKGRPLGLSPSAWPPLRAQSQPNGSGMRAVFLGNPSAKRECAGTGVFLPRQVGNQPETRRKPACSTVLLPARVVQALNLNLEDVCAQTQLQRPRFNGRFAPDSDVTLRLRSDNVVSHQKRNMRSQPPVNHEIRLPQDWTY